MPEVIEYWLIVNIYRYFKFIQITFFVLFQQNDAARAKKDRKNARSRERYAEKMADPEEAERIRAIQREKVRRWKERKVAYWSTGTEQALQDRTNFLKKNSEQVSRSRVKQDSTSRTTSYTPRPKPAVRRKDLSS